jgi:hypothetical protein
MLCWDKKEKRKHETRRKLRTNPINALPEFHLISIHKTPCGHRNFNQKT